MPILTIVAAVALAAPQPEMVRDFLSQNPGLRQADGVCPTPAASLEDLPTVLLRDISGDGQADAVVLVRSKEPPVRFGVVALHAVRGGNPRPWWVHRLGRSPLTGLEFFHSPYGDWILVRGCDGSSGGSFRWTGTQYEKQPVW